MKNSQKNLKNRSLLLAAGALLCASLLLLVNFFLSCLKVSALEVNDDFTGWVYYQTNANFGNNVTANVRVSLAEEQLSIPFSIETIGGSDLAIGAAGGSVNVSGLIDYDSVYYHMTGNYDTFYPIQVYFGSGVWNTYISGTISVPIWLFRNFETPDFEFFQSDGTPWSLNGGSLVDRTQRWSLSGDGSGNGYRYSVTPSNTDGFYYLNIVLEDYFVGGAVNQATAYLGIDLDFNYHFDLVACDSGPSIASYGSCLQPISAALAYLRPYLYTSEYKVDLHLPSFYLSNEYYSILNAINNSNLGDLDVDMDTQLNLIRSNVNSLYNLLYSWLHTDQQITVPWNQFVIDIMSYMGEISTYLGDSLTHDTQLYNSMQQVVYYGSLVASRLSTTNSHLVNIYNILSNGTHTYDSDGSYINTGDFSSLLAGLFFAFTGDNMDIYTNEDGDIYTSIADVDVRSYNRWVDIIENALAGIIVENQDVQDISDDIITDDNYIHLYLEDQWDEVFTNIPNRQWWVDKATAPVSVLATAGWWVSVLDYVYSHLGVFIFVVNTILTVGILMIVLGKINQISKATSRKA